MTETPMAKPPAVVIIEDDDEIAEMVRVVVEEAGARAHLAKDGRTGLDLVRKLRPAVTILDIMMPRMNGYEVCAAIQSDTELAGTRIVVMTGLVEKTSEKTEEEWRDRMEVADFVVKPFDVNDLSGRIRKMLQP